MKDAGGRSYNVDSITQSFWLAFENVRNVVSSDNQVVAGLEILHHGRQELPPLKRFGGLCGRTEQAQIGQEQRKTSRVLLITNLQPLHSGR